MKYVPILKCKRGEQQALKNLAPNVSENICPLIEIPYSSATTKGSITDLIASFWNDRPFYFYFTSDWYDELDSINSFIMDQEKSFAQLCQNQKGIPVLDLSSIDTINEWAFLPTQGIAIRLRNNEFGEIESTLNPLFEKTPLKRETTDLLLDLQYVHQDDLFAKTSVLKAAFSDLDQVSSFRSIIISSGSFPKQLPPMEINKIYRFRRTEPEVFTLSLKLSERLNFNYIYSDYGPTDFQETAFVIGMSPNFKIKYTTFDEFIYIKGLPIKRGGLDIENVRVLCRTLVNSEEDFSGQEFSWGDNCIYRLANNLSQSSGNLTTWVSYSMNHHITLINSLV